MLRTLQMEWRYTYKSARREPEYTRCAAARMFARELLKGWFG